MYVEGMGERCEINNVILSYYRVNLILTSSTCPSGLVSFLSKTQERRAFAVCLGLQEGLF